MDGSRLTARVNGLTTFSLATFLLLPIGGSCAQDQSVTPVNYSYYYRGELISLTPSQRLVAVSETGAAFRAFASEQGLERDPLSEHSALRARNVGIYRRVSDEVRSVDPQAELARLAETAPVEIQPVFEQGQSLLIPSNEIIVGFAGATTLEEAQRFAASQPEGTGIIEVRPQRRNSYIMVIDNPANGRVYLVSQLLTALREVEFAEPNHIVLPVEAPGIR